MLSSPLFRPLEMFAFGGKCQCVMCYAGQRNVAPPTKYFPIHSSCHHFAHRIPHPHPGTPGTRSRSVHPHLGTPDTDVTVPLPARYVTDQATIIRQQISSTQDGCSPSIIANSILMEEIFCLQNRLILLRGS